MKKLLLCAFALIPAFAMNAMQNKQITKKNFFDAGSLSMGLAGESSNPYGVITRTALQVNAATAPALSTGIGLAATTAQNAIDIASDVSAQIATRITILLNRLTTELEKAFAQPNNQTQNNNNDLQTWEEITTDPALLAFLTKKIHGSFKETPEQDNDEWQDLYHDKETIEELMKPLKNKRSMLNEPRTEWIKKASENVSEAQQLLPENLRTIINPDLDGVDPVTTLKAISDTYTCYVERAKEDFPQQFIDQTIMNSLKECDIKDPQQVYAYLGSNNQDGVKLSHQDVLQCLATKRAAAEIIKDNTGDETYLWRVRQIEFIIGQSLRHEAFNAYIIGGKQALSSFQVDPLRMDELVTCRNNISKAAAEIEDYDRRLKPVNNKIEKLTTHLQTLS
jgi:hypothetical protein